MKKLSMLLLALILLVCGCGNNEEPLDDTIDTLAIVEPTEEVIEIQLWVYPIGNWSSSLEFQSILQKFNDTHSSIVVSMRVLDYTTGDSVVEDAIARGDMPDIIFEGPERLVANWSQRGLMVDLSELYSLQQLENVYQNVKDACKDIDQSYYMVPLCMSTHCMAINRDLFERAGALQYIDEDSRTWSVEDFTNAVTALHDYGIYTVGSVYCADQSGDQGTRALVTNMFGGRFANEEHTAYCIDTDENVRALELLQNLDGIRFNSEEGAVAAIDEFCDGKTAMVFCWNASLEIAKTITTKSVDFDILPMTFPSESGEVSLQGGIWGLGAFNTGDQERIEASIEFIRFMLEDKDVYSRAVTVLGTWPVYDMGDIYMNDSLMSEYGVFSQYLGDYYQVTSNWTMARAAWWKLLQEVGNGSDVHEAIDEFMNTVN